MAKSPSRTRMSRPILGAAILLATVGVLGAANVVQAGVQVSAQAR